MHISSIFAKSSELIDSKEVQKRDCTKGFVVAASRKGGQVKMGTAKGKRVDVGL
jgi:hypothetical protein